MFVTNFVTMFNRPYEVIVVFDKYDEYSFKLHEHQRRAKGQSHRNYVVFFLFFFLHCIGSAVVRVMGQSLVRPGFKP